MREQKRGAIINLGSYGGKLGSDRRDGDGKGAGQRFDRRLGRYCYRWSHNRGRGQRIADDDHRSSVGQMG